MGPDRKRAGYFVELVSDLAQGQPDQRPHLTVNLPKLPLRFRRGPTLLPSYTELPACRLLVQNRVSDARKPGLLYRLAVYVQLSGPHFDVGLRTGKASRIGLQKSRRQRVKRRG